MRHLPICIFFISSIPFSVLAGTLRLQEVIEKTVTANPEVQVKYHTFLAAEQEQNAAHGGLLPKADIVSTYRRQETMFPNNFGTNIPDRQTQLVLKQMVFDGFMTTADISRLGHIARSRYYDMMSTIQGTAQEATLAYNDVLRYRELVDYAKDNYIIHKQLFDLIEEKVGAGVARRVDLEQASGRLALAEANLLTETTNLHDVTARYQRLVGDLPSDDLQEIDFEQYGVEANPTDALQVAYRNNPELLSAIENIVATQEEVRGRRGRYSPRLDLQARKNLDVSSDGRNSSSAADVLELTLTFNLFNGLTDKALVNQSMDRLNSAEDLRDKACVDTRQQLVIAYNDIIQLKAQLGYRDQHQLSIEKAREAYRKQFDIGQRTLLDLLDTENEYFQARRSYTNTQRDLYAAYAKTYASQGELLNKLNVTRSDIPNFVPPDNLDTYSICQAVAPETIQIDKTAIVNQAKPLRETLASLNKPATPSAPVPPVASSSNPAAMSSGDEQSLRQAIAAWKSAWEQKDIDHYLDMYASDFLPDQHDRTAWVAQRKKRLSTAETITLGLENIQVEINGNQATVHFKQYYAAGKFSDVMNKELKWVKNNNQWRIIKESGR